MGKPKFLLKYDNKTVFLEQIAHGYASFGCKEIIVVLNDCGLSALNKASLRLPDNVKIVLNTNLEYGRFYSLKLALTKLNLENIVFVHNVDNPVVNQSVLRKLIANIGIDNYVVPEYEGRRGHPILISKKIAGGIVSAGTNSLNLKEFLKIYLKKTVLVGDENILLNLNTKEDFYTFKNSFL